VFVSPVLVFQPCPPRTEIPPQPCPVVKLKTSFSSRPSSLGPENPPPRPARGPRPTGVNRPRSISPPSPSLSRPTEGRRLPRSSPPAKTVIDRGAPCATKTVAGGGSSRRQASSDGKPSRAPKQRRGRSAPPFSDLCWSSPARSAATGRSLPAPTSGLVGTGAPEPPPELPASAYLRPRRTSRAATGAPCQRRHRPLPASAYLRPRRHRTSRAATGAPCQRLPPASSAAADAERSGPVGIGLLFYFLCRDQIAFYFWSKDLCVKKSRHATKQGLSSTRLNSTGLPNVEQNLISA
jgi:hypothetical protein